MSANQTKSASIPKTEHPTSVADQIKSLVRNTLLASPMFPKLYADVVISSAPNSYEGKLLAANYQKIIDHVNTHRTNMPTNSHIKICTHIKVNGVRCGSPALRGEPFCYFHQRMISTVKGPNSRLHPVALLENEDAIQASIMEIVNALIRGTIDVRRGELILRALNIAVRNARRVNFSHARNMITKVPNFTDPHKNADKPNTCPPNANAEEMTPAEAVAAYAKMTQAWTPAPEPDPTQRKPPLGVKEAEAPKERKIAVHGASRG